MIILKEKMNQVCLLFKASIYHVCGRFQRGILTLFLLTTTHITGGLQGLRAYLD